MEGTTHVSVHIITSGFVLSIRFLSLHCFDLIDWQLTFSILIGVVFVFVLLLQFLIGVDAWIGFVVPTEDGLWNDATESILNWFDVLSVRSKHT